MLDSNDDVSKRDIPSFIEPRPPLILNPFMRPRPQKGTNLLELFEDSECEEPELLQVYLRLKPCNRNSNLYEVRSERCLVTSLDTTTAGHGRRTQHNVSKMYTFSHIFRPDSDQSEIFEHVVKNNLKKLPEGHSFTLLTYGASGSGKTYTLMGTVKSPGLVPRSLDYVFKIIDAAQKPVHKPSETGSEVLSYNEQDYELEWVNRLRQISAPLRDKYRRMSASLYNNSSVSNLDITGRTKHYVWVSFIEIYNEGIYDLLVSCDRRAASKLAIREDLSGNIYVKGATQAFVRSGEEAYDVMVAGKHNLQVAATGVHAQSSRSHCIFTITMLTEIDGEVRSACVRLCDLAGCERAARTRNTGARMQESRAINSSLHVLERCLHTLRRRQTSRARALVPYRESKLTRLLGAGLSGTRGEAVSMVVTLNPAPEYTHETRHVLQLAAVAKDIQVNNTMSEYPSTLETTQDTTIVPSAEVMMLRADNERLMFELKQAEARKKVLERRLEDVQPAAMDQFQNITELLKEAKQSTETYYEEQIKNLQLKKEEIMEEYETKINQLILDNTLLEEKLTAEKLARARVEEEVQHLRACLEERDEKVIEDDNDEVTSLNESDNINSDEETDPYNESLEPVFKKDDIDRSRLIMSRSLIIQEKSIDSDELTENNDSVIEISKDTLKDEDEADDSAVPSTPENETKNDYAVDRIHKEHDLITDTIASKIGSTKKDNSNLNLEQSSDAKKMSSFRQSIYCAIKENSLYESSTDANCANEVSKDASSNVYGNKDDFEVSDNPTTFVNSIINSLKKPLVNNNSLEQFERLEIEAQNYSVNKQEMVEFSNIKILKDKRKFFEETECISTNMKIHDKKSFSDNEEVQVKDKKYNTINECQDNYRSPSIVKDESTSDFEPNRIKKLLGKSETKPIESCVKANYFLKKHDSVDVFEGMDSPIVFDKLKDELPNIDDIRKSLAKVKVTDNSNKSIVDNQNILDNSSSEIRKVSLSPCHDKKFNLSTHVKEVDTVVQESLEKCANIEDSHCYKNLVQNNLNLQNMDDECVDSLIQCSKLTTEINNEFNENLYDDTENLLTKKSTKKISSILSTDLSTQLTQNIQNTLIGEVNKSDASKYNDSKIFHKPVMNKPKDDKIHLVQTDQSKKILPLKDDKVQECDERIQSTVKIDNTLEEFENIYKDVSVSRCTEFDLLVIQTETTINDSKKSDHSFNSENLEGKYNLRNKCKTEKIKKVRNRCMDGEILMESLSKCESSAKPKKRNLRLRRRKDDDSIDDIKNVKLKDIANLQTEFSDIVMDIPAPPKHSKDIPSPEVKADENVPPILGIQSCPSKSVTRSRRKLFTPRAEPLDESENDGESEERVRVPRPSYHRPRARRKL